MVELIDRKRVKEEVRQLLAEAEVSPRRMTALYLAIVLLLSLVDALAGQLGMAPAFLSEFVSVCVMLMNMVLSCGFTLYCMAIRRGEQAEYLTIFDGFGLAGRIIALQLVIYAFTSLWALLFVIPGIIASYRYRFALYNLLVDQDEPFMLAFQRSKFQTKGYKLQLFQLDMSYLGWIILASVPDILMNVAYSATAVQNGALAGGMATIAYTTPSFLQTIAAAPDWLFVLISGIWTLLIGMLYYPEYQCAELAYFEIAKSTNEANRPKFRQDSPDGL